MDSQTTLAPYIASSPRIGVRPWNRRRDRGQIERWPPYIPALPSHWTAAPPACGERVSYAVDLLAMSPADRLIGRVDLQVAQGAARLGIVLHPQQLGAGFGTEAMRLILAVARQIEIVTIRLDVAAENLRARRCYMRVGFVDIGESWRGGFRYVDMARSTEVSLGASSTTDYCGGDLYVPHQ